MLASFAGKLDTVKELCYRRADKQLADKGGSTALYWAMDSGNAELVDWMLDNGASSHRYQRMDSAAATGRILYLRDMFTRKDFLSGLDYNQLLNSGFSTLRASVGCALM